MVGMKKYQQLNSAERERIACLLAQKKSYREIGELLGRHHTTISREVSRNPTEVRLDSDVKLEYLPSSASELAERRRSESRLSDLTEPAVRSYVILKLQSHWSPEQIAGRLKAKVGSPYVSAETIYKFIYTAENKKLRLWEFLKRSHKKRKPLFSRGQRKRKRVIIPDRKPISARPQAANERGELGHLESDLMEGRRSAKHAVSVTVDRRSRYVFLDKLADRNSEARMAILNKRLASLPQALKETLTVDNGLENYYHRRVTEANGTQVYFCNAYHSWEKGTVENSVGLVRNYLPKGTDLSQISQTELTLIERELNSKPRKCLGYYTPFEVMFNNESMVHLR